MSQTALITMLWGHNNHALRAYLANQPRVVITFAQSCTEGLRNIVEGAGSQLVVLESLLTEEICMQVQAEAERRAASLEHLLGESEWQDFCGRWSLDVADFNAILGDGLGGKLAWSMVLVEALDQAASKYHVELALVNEDLMLSSRIICEWARARGVPSLHLAHGAALVNPYTVHAALHADRMAVFGERGSEGYRDIGIAPERLMVTGNPAWDVYASLKLEKPRVREIVYEKYHLNPEAPLVVFGTTWAAFFNAGSYAQIYDDTLAAFLSACRSLLDIGREINIVIKDRPSNDASKQESVNRLASEIGIPSDRIIYTRDDTQLLVTAADALISVDSNLSVEAMLAGTPALNIMSELGLRMGPCFDAESGVLEATPSDLPLLLELVLSDPSLRTGLVDLMSLRAHYFNVAVDGSASERLALLMTEMARQLPSSGMAGKQAGGNYVWQSLGGNVGEHDEGVFYPDVPRKEVVSQFVRPPRRVLEIGCATGATALHLKTLYPNVWVAGIELSESAAAVARGRMDLVISDKFEEADLEGQGIGLGSIDAVILADVLEHMYDPWGVLVRLKPYLTPDAQVIASIPNARNLWLLNELANGRFPYAQVGLLDITHIRFFTRAEIEKLFAETGYAIDSWARTADGRLMNLKLPEGATTVSTDKLLLKDVTEEEFEDFKCLQFLVRARPLPDSLAVGASEEDTPVVRQTRRSGPRRVAVYSRDVRTSACPQVRFFRPFSALQGAWELVWGVKEDSQGHWSTEIDPNADLHVITRIFPGPDTKDVIEAIFATGKPVIYETDDLLIDLPADNMHAQEYAAYGPLIQEVMGRAQAVVVSTPGLAARLKAYNANISVVPNLVDYALFNRTPPDNGRQVNIGVLGTSARGGDFALIDEALRNICQEYGKRIRIKFIGAMPESWVGHANAEAVPFTPDYGGYAARMKGLDLDIGLAPLADNAFNACKSPIKWLEFSALGVAGVFSHVPAYKDVIEQGKTGLMADNKPEKWVTALKLLIENPDYRLQIALAAQLKVYQNHSLQRQARSVMEAYDGLLARHAANDVDSNQDTQAGQGVMAGEAPAEGPDYYGLWQIGHGYQEWDLRWLAERMATWGEAPSVCLGVICRHGDEDLLANNIRSMSQQFHKAWRLVVVAEIAPPDGLNELSQVTWVQTLPEEAIETLNEHLAKGSDGWVGMIEAGDRLPPHATFAVADKALRHPEWRVMFSDEDRLTTEGERHTPFFKTDFNLDMLRAAPFSLGGLFLMERQLFADLGGYRTEAEGVETWDLALRASEELGDAQVGHLADVLYHRYEGGGHCQRPGDDVWAAARDSLTGHLQRKDLPAEIVDGLLPGSFHIKYQIQGTPLVSVIVPTKNKVDLLRNCLTSLIEGTQYSHCELLVVDNGSDDPETLDYLQSLRDLGANSLKVLSYPGPFNFSAMNNMAAREAKGEYLLLLNNDTQILHEDWLDEMLGYAQRADVGAVGARLLYPDGTVQHAGAVLGLGGMGSNHVFRQASTEEPGYFGRLKLPQEYSLVTAACLLTRKSHYEAVGGLDEEVFQVNFNDVDYCLKLRDRGLKVVWTPYATLRHEESVSQAAPDVERLAREEKYKRLYREVEAVVSKWPHWFAQDPAYNRNMSLIIPFQPEPTPALSWDPEWRPAPRVLSIHADAMGCGEYRIIAPMRALTRAGKVMGWDAAGYFHPREYARMDPESVIFQRQLEWGQIEFMQRISRISKAFRIYELDDLITNIPIMSSQKKLFVEQKDINKRFRKAVGLCHRFIVSTDYLAEAFKGFCDEVVTVPNYLEKARWGGLTPKRRGGERARVGWAGSATHAGDLRLIIDVVQATADEVDWVFFGMCPDAVRPLVKEFHDPVKLDDYPARLASLDLDLAIAPLEDIPFNHGKSHLRLLEYGVLGYPVICTDITPYRGDYPVTRVPNKFKAWVEAIRSHVADRDALARQGDALRDHVKAQWMLEDHLDIWLKAWLPG